ncbi:hypothetical protein CYMTET_10644 [Cymbomonas tetramitiformis]|uniref:Uncharacterized protein n=1 Tax=Cymbomonas tetramitiformis TaxID=36881 RepID=A0AAE0LE89_9CHLO|nr:hypothetical protein CYMTET_10644 [Cymbomonas tetramitiformis]
MQGSERRAWRGHLTASGSTVEWLAASPWRALEGPVSVDRVAIISVTDPADTTQPPSPAQPNARRLSQVDDVICLVESETLLLEESPVLETFLAKIELNTSEIFQAAPLLAHITKKGVVTETIRVIEGAPRPPPPLPPSPQPPLPPPPSPRHPNPSILTTASTLAASLTATFPATVHWRPRIVGGGGAYWVIPVAACAGGLLLLGGGYFAKRMYDKKKTLQSVEPENSASPI